MQPVKISDLPRAFVKRNAAAIARAFAGKDSRGRAVADNESHSGAEAQAKDKAEAVMPRFGRRSPVTLRYVSFRHRLADADALFTKWHTDALVNAGVLHDDSAREIQGGVPVEQVESKAEYTVIEIREVI
jgi:hypothetical protein